MSRTKTSTTKRARGNPALRKLQATCKLPTGAVLRTLSAEEVQRLRMRLAEVLECVYTPQFSRRNAVERLAPDWKYVCEHGPRALSSRKIQGDPKKSRSLTRDEEMELFLCYNYCRYRMMRILKAHANRRLTAKATREFLSWDQYALDVRDEIVQANLGLVPSMVERSRLTGVDFAELISEGQMALLRSVDKFDCLRGFKFSTYACRAILTSISRAVALMARYRGQFPTEYDPDLQKGDALETRREDVEANCIQELSGILAENGAELTDTERRVLSERFGVRSLDPDGAGGSVDAKTLRQVAEVFGVTKERVRQIQNKALSKLRGTLDERVFAA